MHTQRIIPGIAEIISGQSIKGLISAWCLGTTGMAHDFNSNKVIELKNFKADIAWSNKCIQKYDLENVQVENE